jgi:xylose isomerase
MGLVDLRSQATRRTHDELIQHIGSFSLDLKFSAGIWFFSAANSRFHEAYGPARSIEQRLEIAAPLKSYGLHALEAHYPNEINEQNLDLWRKFSRDTGIRILSVIPLLFWDKEFEWGSLSNPLEKPRRMAIERTKATLALNKELNTDFAIVWPGIDGYENPFGIDVVGMRDRFFDGLAEAMDAVPGIRIALEPKPYEPRGHIVVGTTAEGMLACRLVESRLRNPANTLLLRDGHSLCGMNPEVGHVLMGYEDPTSAYSWPLSEGRLAHVHLNSQPLGNYDQDLNVGVVSPEQMEAMLYTLKMYGYQGHFGIDINPERMPVDVALKISMDALRAANDRIDNLDHEAILHALAHPDKARGWLEAYLVRSRAARPDRLPPLSPPGTFQ